MIYLQSAAEVQNLEFESHLRTIPKSLVIKIQAAKKFMNKLMRPIITIGLGLVLALSSAALSSFKPPILQGNPGATAFFLQTTPTPQPKDQSKVGSTDGIVAMGFIIALIIIIPILLRIKSWREIQ
jgi:hypothetical protein